MIVQYWPEYSAISYIEKKENTMKKNDNRQTNIKKGRVHSGRKRPKVVSFAKKLKVDDVLTMLKFLWHL